VLVCVVATMCVSRARSQTVLRPNSTQAGTTRNQPADLWINPDEAMTGGQAFFEITVSGAMDLTLSTCGGPAFSGEIYLFDESPLEADSDLLALERSRPDHFCVGSDDENAVQATLIYRVLDTANVRFFIIVQASSRTDDGMFDITASTASMPTPGVSWGLDRIDQRELPLDGRYVVATGAAGVLMYILDTGVRIDHDEFSGRASHGLNVLDDDFDSDDCHGHGTHVAAIAAGRTVGVAYRAPIIAVRVLDCDNRGRVSWLVSGIDWVIRDVAARGGDVAAVVVASVSSGSKPSAAYDDAIARLTSAGIAFVGASGNAPANADEAARSSCNTSPGSATESTPAIIVGATRSDDSRYEQSKGGACTTVWAPGIQIPSASLFGRFAMMNLSGTSQATPFTAGLVADLIALNPTLTPEDTRATLIHTSTRGVVNGLEEQDVDRFLFIRSVPDVDEPPPPSGWVDIYAMLRFSDGACSDETLMSRITDGIASVLGELNVAVPNCGTAPLYADTRATRNAQTALRRGKPAQTEIDTLVRVRTEEVIAAITFDAFEAALSDGSIEAAIDDGGAMSEVESPWVIDSNGYAYWAAPRFESSASSSSLSGGAIAGIVVGSLAVIALLAGCAYIVYVRTRPPPEKQFDDLHGTQEDLEAPVFDRGQDEVRPPALKTGNSAALSPRALFSNRRLGEGIMFSPRASRKLAAKDATRTTATSRTPQNLAERTLASPRAHGDASAANAPQTPDTSSLSRGSRRFFSMGGEAFAQALQRTQSGTGKNLSSH